jgi:DNA repair photolyase
MKIEFLYKTPKTLLNKGTGFLSGYSHSLNPYTGCSFGCSYCYVRQMPVSTFRNAEWGTWVDIKKDAADFLFVQTRSPLVRRDIDLFLCLKDKVRISMTVETDLENIRKHFSPNAPPISARLKTLQLLADSGVPTQVTIAPLLTSSEAFPEMLKSLVNRVCVDDYFMGDGSSGKRTRNLKIELLYKELGLEEWYHPSAYKIVYDRLKKVFPEDQIYVSKNGFEP